MKKLEQFAYRYANHIVNNPKIWLLISVLLFFSLSYGLIKIKSNFSVKIWLDKNDQRILDLNAYERKFGSSETIDIIIKNNSGVFDEKTFIPLKKITDQMWNITDVVRVESLYNYNWIESDEDDINITPLYDQDVAPLQSEIDRRKSDILKDEQIKNNFISEDQKLLYIRSFLRTYEVNPPYTKITKEAEALAQKYTDLGHEVHITGVAYINESLKRASDRDMALVFPIVFIILVIILIAFFRSLHAICYPFALILLSISTTFGIEGYLGLTFNNILSAVPAILIAIGLADSIHVLIGYRHFYLFENQSRKEAAISSLVKNFIPTLLTSITTSVGFISLTTTEITPVRDLGILSGVGTMLAWVFTYIFLGPCLKYIKFKKVKPEPSLFLTKLLYQVKRYRLLIIALTPLLAITMTYYGLQNKINADPIEYFSSEMDIKKTFDMIHHHFGGSRSVEFVFDSGEEDGIKDPAFLKKADKMITWLESREDTVRVVSILNIIKKMNQTLNGDKRDLFTIPDTRRAVADLLFLYTLGLPEGMDLKNQVSIDNRKFRAITLWKVKDTSTAIVKTEEILAKAKEFGLDVKEGGQSPIFNRVNDLVVETFIRSMSLSLPIIFVILLFVFKDLKLALLSLIPNLWPLLIASGVMYFNGDQINIGNVIVFAVCLGIAVDDTIHFIANYKIKRNKGITII